MILSEGAGAILVSREGPILIEQIATGGNFATRRQVATWLREVYTMLGHETDFLIASANGTFIDRAEEEAILQKLPDITVYTGKPALGEGVAAGAMWQIIIAAQVLLTGKLPPTLHGPPKTAVKVSQIKTKNISWHKGIVSTCGLNQQVAGVRLSKAQ
jgi:hypothetical protein